MGIDPSLTGTGIIVLEQGKIVENKLIKTKPTGDSNVLGLERLLSIRDQINLDGIDMVLMEGLAFMARNTSALVQLSALNYFLREKINSKGIKWYIIAPTTLKKAITSKGNAKKDEMLLEVYKKYGESFSDDNLCDAFGLAKVGEMIAGIVELTKSQKEVVELLKKQL